jgi:serine/threonine protein kinase
MLLEKSYDSKIDVWALGILLYEMVHGDAPYGEDTPIPQKMDFIKNNKEFDYSSDLSEDLSDLIKKILQPDPEKRLSMAQIFEHEWMRKFEKNYGINIASFVKQNQRDAKT